MHEPVRVYRHQPSMARDVHRACDVRMLLSNYRRAAAAIVAILGTSSCGSTSTSSISGPSSVRCQVTLNGGNVTFPPQGGNGSVSVSTNRDCSWSAEATAPWIHITSGSGQGDGTLTFGVDQNRSYAERSGEIQVTNAGRVAVRQAAEPPPPPPPPPPPQPDPAPAPPPIPPPAPDAGRTIEIEGKISGLSGSCPVVSFIVDRRLVRATSDTEFETKCADLKNGMKVKVKGVVQLDRSLIATRIEKD